MDFDAEFAVKIRDSFSSPIWPRSVVSNNATNCEDQIQKYRSTVYRVAYAPTRFKKTSRNLGERQSAFEVLPVIVFSSNEYRKTKINPNDGFDRFVG